MGNANLENARNNTKLHKISEQVTFEMYRYDKELLDHWERYRMHECDKWKITRKEMQENQSSSDETEETDDEEAIKRNKQRAGMKYV